MNFWKKTALLLAAAMVSSGVPAVPVHAQTASSVGYTWCIVPSIEAEDIIVSDDAFDMFNILEREFFDSDGEVYYLTEKPSQKFAYIKREGKYSIIDYSGNLWPESEPGKFYENARISEQDEIRLDDGFDNGFGFTIDTDGTDYFASYWLERGVYARYSHLYDAGNQRAYKFAPPNGWNPAEEDEVLLVRTAVLSQEDSGEYYETANGEIYVQTWGKYGVSCGNVLTIPAVYDNGVMSLYNDMVALEKDGKWGYFNGSTGEQVIDFIDLSGKLDYYSDLASYMKDAEEKEEEKTVQRPFAYSDGYLALETAEGWVYYDETGKAVTEPGAFAQARPVHKGMAWVQDAETGKWGVISLGQPEQLLGDVNADTAVNAADASEILIAAAKAGAGEGYGLTAEQETAADVNRDGNINATDAAIILTYAAAQGTGADAKIEDFV